MSVSKRTFTSDPTTGFGTRGTDAGERFYQKDGSVNIIRRGVPFLHSFSWYHTMLSMPRWRFYLTLWLVYIIVNFLFAIVYYDIGMENFGGVHTGSALRNFAEAYFFSAQTFTTVGYGRISPVSFAASAVAAFEAFVGLLAFALASGLFFGRFAKPRADLFFSSIALIAPYKEGKALMFRMVPYKNNRLTDAEIKLTLGMRVKEGAEMRNHFYPLNVEFSKITALILNWTIVHPLTEDSPLHGFSLQDMRDNFVELLVIVKAYDEGFASTVVARTSYVAAEFIDNARFKPMYHSSENGKSTVLNIDALNDFDPLQK